MNFFNRAKKMALVSFIAIASFFNPSKAESVDCFNCCNFSFCDWDFTVGADYLYWKPCTSNLDYAVVLDNDPFPAEPNFNTPIHYDIKSVCPDYESGYRVYVNGSSFCGSSIGFSASYTQVKADSSHSVSANARTVLPTVLHPYQEQFLTQTPDDVISYRSASADWESNYRNWCFGVTYHSDWNYCNRVGYFFGIAGMNFHEDFDTYFAVADENVLTGLTAFRKSTLDYCGWGLKFGSHYEYLICKGLNFFTHLNGSVLVGDGSNETTYGFVLENGNADLAPNYVFKKDDCCRVVPGYHLGLGVNYDACICNLNFNFRIGYEFVGWYNIPFYRTFVEGIEDLDVVDNPRILNLAISSSADVQDLSYHGMFVGLAFQF